MNWAEQYQLEAYGEDLAAGRNITGLRGVTGSGIEIGSVVRSRSITGFGPAWLSEIGRGVQRRGNDTLLRLEKLFVNEKKKIEAMRER